MDTQTAQTDRQTERERLIDRLECKGAVKDYLTLMVFVLTTLFGSLKPTIDPFTWFTAAT